MSTTTPPEHSCRKVVELEAEVAALKQRLEDRKTIDRAKGILIDAHRWPEGLAYRFLQKTAMDLRLPLAEVARRILELGPDALGRTCHIEKTERLRGKR